MSRWFAVLAFAMALSLPTRAATGQDLAAYRLDETDWNGLSSLGLLATHFGVSIRQVDSVSLPDPTVDVLVLVHPTSDLPADALVAWVRSGGRLWVADDFGTADTLMAAFGLRRVQPGFHADVLERNDALPMVAPVGSHPISRGVARIVLNHPTAIAGEQLPVFGLDDGSGVLYDMSLGQGAAVFLADASVLTNLMLPLHGNRRMVVNTLERLCGDLAGCRVVLVAEAGGVVGDPDAMTGGDEGPSERAAIPRWREALDALRDARIDPRALRVAAALLLFGTLFLVATLFPARRPRWLGARFGAAPSRPRTPFEHHLRRLSNASTPNLGPMLGAYREQFEPAFYGALGWKVPDGDPGAAAHERAAKAYVARAEPGASARRIRRVAKVLGTIAAAGRRDGSGRVAWIEPKGFIRCYDEAQAMLHALEKEERRA